MKKIISLGIVALFVLSVMSVASFADHGRYVGWSGITGRAVAGAATKSLKEDAANPLSVNNIAFHSFTSGNNVFMGGSDNFRYESNLNRLILSDSTSFIAPLLRLDSTGDATLEARSTTFGSWKTIAEVLGVLTISDVPAGKITELRFIDPLNFWSIKKDGAGIFSVGDAVRRRLEFDSFNNNLRVNPGGVHQLEGGDVRVPDGNLQLGNPANRKGITVFDQGTGVPFCIAVNFGALVATPGACV